MAFENPFLVASGKSSGNPFFPDEEPTTSDLPLWRRNELLDQLGAATRTTASTLFGALGVPASLAYDVALARPLFSGSTGGEVLDDFKVRPSKEALGGWGRPIADFFFGAATDPLNLIGFGTGTAAKAAQAAKAAGLWDDVGRVASRRLIDDAATGARTIDGLGDFGHARNATNALDNAFNHKGIENFTDDDLLSRPLVGKRMAARDTRLRDLVDAQGANSGQAISDIDDFLAQYGQTYGDVANDYLGNDVSLWLPKRLGGEIGTQLPGGRTVAAALDRSGQAMRWSTPGRYSYSAFGNVKGTTQEGDQITAMGLARGDKAADEAANRLSARLTRQLQETAPQVFDNPALSNAVRNVIEGTASSAQRQLVTNNNLDSFVTDWQRLSGDYIKRSQDIGIGSSELQDAYGTQYFPRGVDRDVFRRGRSPADGGRDYAVTAGDQLARSAAYHTPGGTDTLNALSRDARVHQAATDNDAADYIYNEMNQRVQALNQGRAPDELFPAYSRAHAVKLARDIRSMRPEAVEAGRGLFDSHFTEDMSRYIRSRERAIRRAKFMEDTIGSSARLENYLDVDTAAHGRHNSLNQTLANLGLRSVDLPTLGPVQPPYGPFTRSQLRNMPQGPNIQQFLPDQSVGAKQQIVDRINARLAGTGTTLTVDDLANVSVDEALVARFERIADYYVVPEIQNRMTEALDGITRLWKSSVLAWGSRFLRDWYSGGVSNVVEVGDVAALQRGYAGGKYLIQGQFDRLADVVRQMPRYADLAATDIDAAINQYRDELAEFGLVQSRGIEDFGANLTNSQTGQGLRDQLLPGAAPRTTMGYQFGDLLKGRTPLGADAAAYSELGNLAAYGDSLSRFGQAVTGRINAVDYLNETAIRDPILRWSSKLGDTTDSINRLGGYNGLLLLGVNPKEAARRMARAHVDYGSLTTFEKNFIRRAAPFWAYSSRMGAYVVSKMWERPGGAYTQMTMRLPETLQQGVGSDGEYVPQQIRKNFGLNLEPMRDLPGIGSLVNAVAPSTDGVVSYLDNIDLPGTDLINMVRLRRGLDGSIQVGNTAKQSAFGAISQLMHPGIRGIVELMTGQNLHTGKSLREYEPTTQKVGRALGVTPFSGLDEGLKYGAYLADYIPHAPRVLQLTNRLMDSERVPDVSARMAQNAVNMLSGMAVTNISEDAAKLDASRELGEMLGESPALRTFEQKFIPEEMLPYASPEDLLLYRLDRQMRSEARKARKKLSDSDSTNPFIN